MNKILTGTPASSGKASGTARVILEERDFADFEEGDVLVARITDPTMTILMNRAAAIVCDIGGITSHPAIVSRELGVPCVVNTKNATQLVRTGQKLTVDGDSGEIYTE